MNLVIDNLVNEYLKQQAAKFANNTNHNQTRTGSRSSRLHSLSITNLPNCSITNSFLSSYVLPCLNQPRSNLLGQRNHIKWLMLEQAP